MYLPPAQDVKGIRTGYFITEYFRNSNPTVKIDAKNVCHIRNFNPSMKTGYDNYSGLSRLHSLSHLIDTYNESIETEASIYKDKGVRTIVFPKGQSDVNDVSIEQGESQRDRFNRQLKETGQGGIITSKVEMGSITLGYSPKDLGILESKVVTKIDVCAAYHIPPEIFSWGAHSAYENLAENVKIALNDAILPEYEKKTNSLNKWLTPSYDPDGKQGLYIGYNYDNFNALQPNKKELSEWMKNVPLTANETREAFGYEALKDENADKILISGNFKLLEDMGMDSFSGNDGVNPFDSNVN
jgi:phage portal protein BeeE